MIKWWAPPTSTSPELLVSDLKNLLSDKTVMVTCTHASNILGTIHDIKALADAVHEVKDALFCVDGVSYAPHRSIDVKALGVDFYAFSWYKVFRTANLLSTTQLINRRYTAHTSLCFMQHPLFSPD